MVESQTPRYKYDALPEDSIRLLKILEQGAVRPALTLPDGNIVEADDDAICVELKTHALSATLHFDALSYTWSTPLAVFADKQESERADQVYGKQSAIFCNGSLFLVGTNLQRALFKIRLLRRGKQSIKSFDETGGKDWSDYIWVDAICIDQNNTGEKSSQVSIMHEIYSLAQKTFFWLGDFDGFVRPAQQAIGAFQKVKMDQAFAFRSSWTLESRDYASVGMSDVGFHEWICLYAVLQRSWFRRTWILQEAALARVGIVMCGAMIFNWGSLARAAWFLDQSQLFENIKQAARGLMEGKSNLALDTLVYRHRLYEPADNLFEIHQDQKFNPVRIIMMIQNIKGGLGISDNNFKSTGLKLDLDFLSLLKVIRRTFCQDPRDKVYGALGIFAKSHHNKADKPLLRVDYHKTVAAVYTEAAWVILRSTADLGFMSYCRYGSTIPGLPSWVPDWSAPLQMSLHDTAGPDLEVHPWVACGQTKWSPRDCPSGCLFVRGLHLTACQTLADLIRDDLWAIIDLFSGLPSLTFFPEVNRHRTKHPPQIPLRGTQLYSATTRLEIGFPASSVNHQELAGQDPPGSHSGPDPAVDLNNLQKGATRPVPPNAHELIVQTRFEVLWRTLIHDMWQMHSPAPSRAGHAFAALLTSKIVQIMSASWLCDSDQSEIPKDNSKWHEKGRAPAENLESERPRLADTQPDSQDPGGSAAAEQEAAGDQASTDPQAARYTTEENKQQQGRSLTILKHFAKYERLDLHLLELMLEGSSEAISVDSKDGTMNVDLDAPLKGEEHMYLPRFTNTSDFFAKYLFKSMDLVKISDEWVYQAGQVHHEKLFSTKEGLLGTAKSGVEVGDELWLIEGCPFPCLLRKRENGNYRLVTEAYVHGVMHGEIDLEAPGAAMQDIVLE